MASKNIPLIHNFCDRWCERCTFTSRCAIFEDEKNITPEQQDIKNKAFWERLSHNFSKAKSLLEEAAKKSGIDLNALDLDMEEEEKKKEEMHQRTNAHPAAVLGKEYSTLTHGWLKTQPGMLDKLEDIKKDLTLGVESQQHAREQIEMIKESLAVIEWYSAFIYVKTMRALMSREDDHVFEDVNQSDANGSAKICLIGIERSIQAWANVFEILPGEEDHFLKVLSMLEKIKKEILVAFPNALEFVRPGFDEVSVLRK